MLNKANKIIQQLKKDSEALRTEHSNKDNVCVHCGSENIYYGCSELKDGGVMFPYTCGDCKKNGRLWYNLEFADNLEVTK